MTKRIAFLAAVLALLALPARADYSDGVSAFARGDYAMALVAFKSNRQAPRWIKASPEPAGIGAQASPTYVVEPLIS